MRFVVSVLRACVLVVLVALVGGCAALGSNFEGVRLRSALVYDNPDVLRILQQYPPQATPLNYGGEILHEVDAGRITPVLDKVAGTKHDYIDWYFRAEVGLPPTLPWVDSQNNYQANTRVLPSKDFPGWVYAEVRSQGRLVVPQQLLLKAMVCARAYHFKTVDDITQTKGPFKGVHGVLCANPEHMGQRLAAGYRWLDFVMVKPADENPQVLRAAAPAQKEMPQSLKPEKKRRQQWTDAG